MDLNLLYEHAERVVGFVRDHGAFFTVVLGLLAALRGLVQLRRINQGLKAAYYAELDRLYIEILKLGIASPWLRKPRALSSDADIVEADYDPFPDTGDPDQNERRAAYESYAYMVWNFLETIRDRCVDQEELRTTWAPVIGTENRIHRGWFLQQMREEARNAHICAKTGRRYECGEKFSRSFQVFIVERRWEAFDGRFSKWVKGGNAERFDALPKFQIDGHVVALPNV